MRNLKCYTFVVSSLVLLGAAALHAAILQEVPMQGSMVMPMVSYHAAQDRLSIMIGPAVPLLTPLLASNPFDDFDPADPWFDLLSPRREGLAFSRRYGFVMDAMTDLLPESRQMWIRRIASSPGLGMYRYSSGEQPAFQPIFGTGGASDALQWNGMMFHPTFTAPPGTNAYTATFEAYLVDAATGSEVANSSTGRFILNWTTVPDGRPELLIEPGSSLTWPASAANYIMESTEEILGGNWTPVSFTPELVDDRLIIRLEPAAPRRFFRLKLTQE